MSRPLTRRSLGRRLHSLKTEDTDNELYLVAYKTDDGAALRISDSDEQLINRDPSFVVLSSVSSS